jgi:hypothetical protein
MARARKYGTERPQHSCPTGVTKNRGNVVQVLVTTEVSVTGIEDRPSQSAKPHAYVADYERTDYTPAFHLTRR